MQGQAYAPWEIRSAVLSDRVDTLKTVAIDKSVPLTDEERAALVSVADKLIAEAHAVARRR